jgi:hypothetical protein
LASVHFIRKQTRLKAAIESSFENLLLYPVLRGAIAGRQFRIAAKQSNHYLEIHPQRSYPTRV